MSYAKVPKVVTDAGVGFRTVNQLGSNIEAVSDEMGVEHGTSAILGAPGFSGPAAAFNFNALGLHNGGGVPRCTLWADLVTLAIGGTQLSIQWQSNPIVNSFTKLATGSYFIGVVGLATFWAQATPLGTAVGDVRIPPAVWAFTDPTKGPVGLWVQVYDQASAGAAFALADKPFSMTIYGPV